MSRKEHLTRKKHQDAVANQATTRTSVIQPTVLDPGPAPQARLNLSDILLDSDSEDGANGTHRAPSPLNDIMMDGNQFFDAERNEILFSAGTEETGAARRQELLEAMKNLDFYDHSVFGKINREDPTISDAVAAMAEMGKSRQHFRKFASY